MLANHFKIALRSLWRNRVFSVINMLGLSIGFTVFLLIMQYVAFEWSANRFHQNYKSLCRVSFLLKDGQSNYYMPPGLAPALKLAIPGISQAVRIGEDVGSGVVNFDNGTDKKAFRESRVSFVDGNFLSVFSFPVLMGSSSLSRPQTMAISKSTAVKYFGNGNPVGKVVNVNNQFGNTPYTITGVYADMPQNSDIQADILLSYTTLENPAFRNRNDWADPSGLGSEYAFIYLQTSPQANADALDSQATNLWHKLKPDSKTTRVGLQPMSSLHLAPGFSYPFQTFGSLLLIISFLIVAILIMVIAWVNYINLSTAQAINRAKDVGVRKVLGASRGQLTWQYLSETIILTLFSMGLALLAVLLLQSAYNNFLGKQLSLSILNQGWFWPVVALLTLIGVLLSGGYVAVVLSSFNPLKTIRGKASISIGGLSLRKSLVVFQFVTSIVFIIATITLYRQLQYMQTQNLGMQLDQRMAVTGPSIVNSSEIDNSVAFEQELGRLPFVKQYAASNNIPGQGYNFSTSGITRLNPEPGDEKKSYAMLIVDDRYFDAYNISVKYGTAFTPPMLEHGWPKTKKVILNESAVKELGFKPDDPNIIGQKISWGGDFEVVGVVKDYHHLALHELIKPMIFLPAVADGFFTIKMAGGNMQAKVTQIQALYKNVFPSEPFTYVFLDEVYDKQYKSEKQLGRVFIAAALVAVLIACMGLFGLAAFAARQKVKEIGIRKVLGAGVWSIVNLLSADFLKMVLIALLIASPLAWWAMHRWLQAFAYRAPIQWWVFILAGGVALLIAFATVSFQAVKAAVANPVKSLRAE